jgi:hypothetical protein
MAMNFEELTPTVRARMRSEYEAEVDSGHPFESSVMSREGLDAYPELLRAALAAGNETTLTVALSDPRYWKATNARSATVNPEASASALALTEFNTWYVAGLAAVLRAEGATHCEVYRAEDPNGEEGTCKAHEEQIYPLADVIAGHRIQYWPRTGLPVRGAFSVPAGTNCHHTIRRCRP